MNFLNDAGWRGARRSPLAGDASFRRYERVANGDRRAVLMDAPPPQEDVRPFAAMARHLLALGLSAPTILAEDAEHGFLLLEDFGDHTYTRMLEEGADESALYALAVDVLIDLHHRPPETVIPPGLPAYDDATLLDEAFLLTDWYMPAVLDRSPTESARATYAEAWLSVFPIVHAQPRTLVLRDFHVDNLMWIEGRSGISACGLLDFQDALAGNAAYDLMSLLEDARRDIDPRLHARMRKRYVDAFPGLDRTAFETAFTILGAQRHAKVIGIFTRLYRRDGKADYLVHIPRVWRMLERTLRHPVLSPIAAWIESHVPTDKRGVPSCQATTN
jgi:aminoglycoside/choline kinase family phosphotransferase